MQRPIRFALAVAAVGLCGLTGAIPSEAQSRRHWHPRFYSQYQNPDGTYNSAAAYSRDFWGVPCGIECTREAQQRWARYYGQYPVPYGP